MVHSVGVDAGAIPSHLDDEMVTLGTFHEMEEMAGPSLKEMDEGTFLAVVDKDNQES